MTCMTIDDATRDVLRSASGPVELCDREGRLLGTFNPLPTAQDYAEADASVPIEELERRLREESGRPLAEILTDLDESAGLENEV